MEKSTGGRLLCVIVEVSGVWWGRLVESWGPDGPVHLRRCVHSIAAFANLHQLRHARNRLLVLAATSQSHLDNHVYADDPSTSVPGEAAGMIAKRLSALLEAESEGTADGNSRLAGPLSAALCYANRLQKEGAVEESRILVLKVSSSEGSGAGDALALTSCVFAAAKLGVSVSGVGLGVGSAVLEQAADETGGVFRRLEAPSSLLVTLQTELMGNGDGGALLGGGGSGDVDFRPSCFCHQAPIRSGWVCSVCLSVFCAFTPICPTCQAAFKFLPPPALMRKRKLKPKAKTPAATTAS